MVQASSIALFATIALCAVSPSFAAAVPPKPVSSAITASSTSASSTTSSSTTSSSVTAQTPAAATPAWISQEEGLLTDLAALQNYFLPDAKQSTNNTDLQLNKDGNTDPTPTFNDGKLDNDLAAVDPFSSSTSLTPSAITTNPATQQQNPVLQGEFKVLGDLEQLLKTQSTMSSRDFDSPETAIREEPGTWVRGYDNSQNDARDFSQDSGNQWVREYDSANDARDLDLNNGNWVRGYDNSQNDVRDFEGDMEYAARDGEPESFERDFDDDEFYQRHDFEELEDLE